MRTILFYTNKDKINNTGGAIPLLKQNKMKTLEFNEDHRKSLTRQLMEAQSDLTTQLRLLLKKDRTEEMTTFIQIDIELLEARIEQLVELIGKNKISF